MTAQKIVNRQLSIVKRKFKGFTLIELLIVITIIGILATFVVASFSSAQAKGRDSRRKADLDALKKALELAKSDTTNGNYPGCPVAPGSPCTFTSGMSALLPDITTTYIKSIPLDPKDTGTYDYTYTPGCATSSCASTYSLTDCLENANEPTGGYVTSVTTTTCSSGRKYQFTNP